MPWYKVKKTEGEVLKEYAIPNGIATEKIFVMKVVENTADEAVAVKEIISSSKRIILVTSLFHMYTSKRLFEKEGLEVIPYKVVGNSKLTLIDLLTSSVKL